MNLRCQRGQTKRIRTRHIDNPSYFDAKGTPTDMGAAYLDTLSTLTGPKRERWLNGLWTSTENACYPFDRAVHVRPLEDGIYFKANIIWVDYGSRHICSVGCLGIDQFNRRWMRECWGKPDTDQGETLVRVVSEFKQKFSTNRGRVDPNQAFLAGRLGFAVAKGGNGGAAGAPRLHRVDLMEPLFHSWPGGYVPTFNEDKRLDQVMPAREGSDTPGFFVVEGCAGGDEFADQIEGYHYIYTETPRGVVKDVFRDNEDHVAGAEYANEEWEEGEAPGVYLPPQAQEVKYAFAQNERRSPFERQRKEPASTVVRVG